MFRVGRLTIRRRRPGDTARMDFENLTLEQKLAVQELEIRALRNEVQNHDEVLAALIDLLSKPSGSAEFAHDLKKLLTQRDAMRRRRAGPQHS